MTETGLFRDRVPIAEERHRQIKIADLNSENQNEMPPRRRQRPARRTERRDWATGCSAHPERFLVFPSHLQPRNPAKAARSSQLASARPSDLFKV